MLKSEDFPLFSAASRFPDDTVLTIATAEQLLLGEGYALTYKKWSQQYPNAGVIDPTKVTRLALENAVSVAGMMLITYCVVAEEAETEENK